LIHCHQKFGKVLHILRWVALKIYTKDDMICRF